MLEAGVEVRRSRMTDTRHTQMRGLRCDTADDQSPDADEMLVNQLRTTSMAGLP